MLNPASRDLDGTRKILGKGGWLRDLEGAFLAFAADALDEAITENGARLIKKRGGRTPSHCVSTMLFLDRAGRSSNAAIAAAFDCSHQLARQRTERLEAMGLVRKVSSKTDRREKLIALTTRGRKEIPILEQVCADVAKVFAKIQKELKIDLSRDIDAFVARLNDDPLYRDE